MRIALTGATGVVGRFVLADLLARGCQVRALRRQQDHSNTTVDGLSWIIGDLQHKLNLDVLVQECDALVHCAFEHKQGRYRGGEGSDPVNFWRLNLLGTLQLLEAARTAGVKRIVLLSSRAVFTGHPDKTAGTDQSSTTIADDCPQRPDTHYGALKSTQEMLSGVYSRPEGPVISSIRPTGVYGLLTPATDSKWYALARDVLAGRPVVQVKTATEVHGQDLAKAIWLLLTADQTQVMGRGYNCSDLILSTRELVAMMLDELGREGPLPPASPPATNIMACEALAALGWRPGGRALLQQTVADLLAAAATDKTRT